MIRAFHPVIRSPPPILYPFSLAGFEIDPRAVLAYCSETSDIPQKSQSAIRNRKTDNWDGEPDRWHRNKPGKENPGRGRIALFAKSLFTGGDLHTPISPTWPFPPELSIRERAIVEMPGDGICKLIDQGLDLFVHIQRQVIMTSGIFTG